MKFSAALRGIKLDLGSLERSVGSATEFSPEQEALAEKRMRDLVAQKQAEHRGANG